MRILSWNLLRDTGATLEDIAAIIEEQQPDLVFLQEATQKIQPLQGKIGGFHHQKYLPHRKHGLGIWSPYPVEPPSIAMLPVSKIKPRDQRFCMILKIKKTTFANVHLSHGQWILRKQLHWIATSYEGKMAIIGDFNAVGPTFLKDFKDVGTRCTTHMAKNIFPFRLDRCLTREIPCKRSNALPKGSSDHRPIVVDLKTD